MTKKEADRGIARLERAGWREGEVVTWWCIHKGRHRNDGYSIAITGRDGGRIRLDTLGAVAARLDQT